MTFDRDVWVSFVGDKSLESEYIVRNQQVVEDFLEFSKSEEVRRQATDQKYSADRYKNAVEMVAARLRGEYQ